MAPYILSYFHSKDPSVNSSDVLIISLISVGFEGIFFFLVSYLAKKFNEFCVLVAGLYSGLALMFACSFITQPLLFFLTFGLALAILGGFILFCAMWIQWRNTPPNKLGLVLGIGLAGYSSGPIAYGFAFTLLINPQNKPAHKEGDERYFGDSINDKFQQSLMYLSLIMFVVGVIGSFCLYERKQPLETKKEEKWSITVKDLLVSKKAYFIFTLSFFRIFFYYFIMNAYKLIGILYIDDDYFLSFVGLLGFSLGAVVKIVFGKLLDHYTWRTCNIVEASIEAFLILAYCFTLHNKYLLGIVTILSISMSSASYVSIWSLSERAYPNDKWVFSFVSSAGVLVIVAVMIILAIMPVIFMQSIGIYGTFGIIFGIGVISVIFVAFADRFLIDNKIQVHDSDSLEKLKDID